MRLSLGKVQDGRLQCCYHGWTYDARGAGESPGTPKLHVQVDSYEALERHGVIWVKSLESSPSFPDFLPQEYYHLCTLQHEVKAPLETALDNFTEIEHTPTTHGVFGSDLRRMSEVEVRFDPTPTAVRVMNRGPQKPLPWLYRLLLGIRAGDHFHDDWTTYFSPIYSIYKHSWSDPAGRRQGRARWWIAIFFTPIDADTTGLMTFAYIHSSFPGPAGGVRLIKPWLIHKLEEEILLDVRMLENLADKSPRLEGMHLSRFDRVLGLNRERIQRLYYGAPPAAFDRLRRASAS